RTRLFGSSVAVCPWTGDGSAVVEVQVAFPSHSSAVPSVLVPFDPPATSSWPAVVPAGSSVAVWPTRTVVIVPADDQVPTLELGLKSCVVASTVLPFFPPVMRMFPFASVVAVCPSRGLDSEFIVLNEDDVGSNKNTDDSVPLPPLPPTRSTLFESWLLLVTSNDAVWFFSPGGGIWPLVAVQVPVPEAGL